ncbi:MAG: hypothetical protein H5T86_11400, partial [Armatimonadetes bacterium]|nr:hypothetical protein [Armatimonadota bacterium]
MDRLVLALAATAVAGCVLLHLGQLAAAQDEVRIIKAWEFDKDGDLEGWRPNSHMKDVEVSGGTLKFTVVDWDPFLSTGVFDEPIVATPTQVIEVRLKAPAKGSAEFFWTNTTETQYEGFSPGKETHFEVQEGWHTYRVRPFWQGEGKIIKLRFDPPGSREGAAQAGRYEVDYIRVIELGRAQPPVPANWDFSDGPQGWTVDGEGKVTARGGWLEAELQSGAKLVAPPVEVDAYSDVFVSFLMSVDRGSFGKIIFASGRTNGLHEVTFRTIADGRPHVYNVPVSVNANWKAPVVYIAVQPGGADSCTARLDWLRTSPEPIGQPEIEITRLLSDDALPRAGRPCHVL